MGAEGWGKGRGEGGVCVHVMLHKHSVCPRAEDNALTDERTLTISNLQNTLPTCAL